MEAGVDAGDDADSHKLGKPRPDWGADELGGGGRGSKRVPDCQTARLLDCWTDNVTSV